MAGSARISKMAGTRIYPLSRDIDHLNKLAIKENKIIFEDSYVYIHRHILLDL